MDVARFLLTSVLLLTLSVFVVKTSEPKCLNSSNGQGFCLYKGRLSWSKARKFCVQNGGILAIDKDQDTHLALMTLVRMESWMENAWIGGKAVPLYWSWILPDGSAQKMYFQGCYEESNKTAVNQTCVNVRNVEDCEKNCDVYEYYSLHKGPSAALAMCCCGRSLGDTYSEHCSKNGCLQRTHFCGSNQATRAWYARGTQSKMIKFSMWKPPSIKEHNFSLCGSVSVNNLCKLVMKVHPCIEQKKSVCSGGRYRGNICKLGERSTGNQTSRRCLKVVHSARTWQQATETCSSLKGMTGHRNQALVKPSSVDVYETLVELLKGSNMNEDYWISATNNVWRWYNHYESKDIKSSHWKDNISRVPRSSQCLAVNRGGDWRAAYCNINRGTLKVTHYICEYTNKNKKVTSIGQSHDSTDTPRTVRTTNIGLGYISTDGHIIKTTTNAGQSYISTDSPGPGTPSTWGQDESKTGDHKEGDQSQNVLTTPTDQKKASLRSEVKVGLGIGGSILLVIVAVVICFISRKMSSASSAGKSVQYAANTQTVYTANGDSQNYENAEDNEVTMYTSIPDTDKSYECVDRENLATHTELRVSNDMMENIVYESVDKEPDVYVSKGTNASNPEVTYSEVAVNDPIISPDMVQSSSTQEYIYSMPNKQSGQNKGNVPERETIMIENEIYNT